MSIHILNLKSLVTSSFMRDLIRNKCHQILFNYCLQCLAFDLFWCNTSIDTCAAIYQSLNAISVQQRTSITGQYWHYVQCVCVCVFRGHRGFYIFIQSKKQLLSKLHRWTVEQCRYSVCWRERKTIEEKINVERWFLFLHLVSEVCSVYSSQFHPKCDLNIYF